MKISILIATLLYSAIGFCVDLSDVNDGVYYPDSTSYYHTKYFPKIIPCGLNIEIDKKESLIFISNVHNLKSREYCGDLGSKIFKCDSSNIINCKRLDIDTGEKLTIYSSNKLKLNTFNYSFTSNDLPNKAPIKFYGYGVDGSSFGNNPYFCENARKKAVNFVINACLDIWADSNLCQVDLNQIETVIRAITPNVSMCHVHVDIIVQE